MASTQTPPAPKPAIRYGLPCRRCNAYFASDLDACPKCHLSTAEPYAGQASLPQHPQFAF